MEANTKCSRYLRQVDKHAKIFYLKKDGDKYSAFQSIENAVSCGFLLINAENTKPVIV